MQWLFRFSLQLLPETCFILRKTEQLWWKMSNGVHIKCHLFLSVCNEPWNFSTVFRKTLKSRISRKSAQCKPICSMRSDGRTDIMKLIVVFHNIALAPKNVSEEKKHTQFHLRFPDQSTCYLWWTKWHRDGFFMDYFRFSLSVWSHQFSIPIFHSATIGTI